MAANISLRTAFSPHALRRLRSSPNSRSSRLVRCLTGIRRCAMQASKSSWKQATAVGNSLPFPGQVGGETAGNGP